MQISQIHKLAKNGKIAFKKHSLSRMFQRKIFVHEIQEALSRGKIIEIYPEDIPLPSCLILGYTDNRRPLHLVIAAEELAAEIIWVITVYEPDLTHWNKGFEKRT